MQVLRMKTCVLFPAWSNIYILTHFRARKTNILVMIRNEVPVFAVLTHEKQLFQPPSFGMLQNDPQKRIIVQNAMQAVGAGFHSHTSCLTGMQDNERRATFCSQHISARCSFALHQDHWTLKSGLIIPLAGEEGSLNRHEDCAFYTFIAIWFASHWFRLEG